MYQLRTFATTPLQKYDQLAQLAATNVTLYYKVCVVINIVVGGVSGSRGTG